MLPKRLLDSITSDLSLEKLRQSSETDDYTCYCLYSAASMWAKASTQDSLENLPMGSRSHVVRVCNSFINRVVENESVKLTNYFRNSYVGNKEINPGKTIVNSLVQARELIQTVDHDSGKSIVSLPLDNTELCLSSGVSILPGITGADREYDYVSALSFIGSHESTQKIKYINNKKWVEDRIKTIKAKPIKIEENDTIRYYDPNSRFKGGFSSDKPLHIAPFDVAICQLDEFGYHFYLKMDNYFYEIIEDSPLINRDSSTPKPRLYRRFTSYLDQITGNNKYRMKMNGDTILIDLKRPLPQHEDSLIRRVMWPRNNMDHQTKFVGFSSMEYFFIEMMKNMGAEAQWVK